MNFKTTSFTLALAATLALTANASSGLRGVAQKENSLLSYLSSQAEQSEISLGTKINLDHQKCVSAESMVPDVCVAPWVFCIDAICDDTPTMVDGVAVSKCKCWEQKSSYSILPLSTGGAPCVMGYEGGSKMCDDMQNGQLISTFRSQNTSYLPASSRAVCPSKTKFAYCWGAKCNKVKNEKTGEDEVICDCPIMEGNGDVTIEAAQCHTNDPCSGIHNSNPPGLVSPHTMKQPACFDYNNSVDALTKRP
jgi:hypothetical protein